MPSNPITPPAETSSLAPVPRLALKPSEAAEALGISSRKLWELTNAQAIPHMRLGRSVLYPVDALRDYLQQNLETARPRRG